MHVHPAPSSRRVGLASILGLFACASCSAAPEEDAPQPAEDTAVAQQALVPPRTVQGTLAQVAARRLNIAAYWNKSYEEAGFGGWSADGSLRSVRRVAAGLLSLERGGVPKQAPSNFPSLVTAWSAGVSRYTFEGTAGIFGEGDYDMNERELVSLLYLFKDRPTLLSNDAAFNLVTKGIYFWHGNQTSHAMQFGVSLLDYSETENHVLMILSSQYLTNQWIRNNYRNDSRFSSVATLQAQVPTMTDGRGRVTPLVTIPNLDYFKNGADLENLLLGVIGRIPHAGWFETNARNYQAISLHALFNLYAFADSEKIRAAARNALDYTAAKFAFQSLDCKRFSPHRRHYDYAEKAGIWENDSAMFIWGALSGACAFNDSYTDGSASTDISTNFFNFNDQSRGFALWALLMNDAQLLGSRRYELPIGIHDFMLDKHNGYWARFQDRFTQNHYRQGYNPRYFYEDGSPYLSGEFVPAPEFTFVTNRFMNVAGGNHVEYDLKGDGLNGRIYDFWARPSAVVPAGHYQFRSTDGSLRHTGDWGGVSDGRRLLNQDLLNMSSRGDGWWYGKNLGVYKNFTIGTDPAIVPRNPRYPFYDEGGRTEFLNEFQTLKYRFQHVYVDGTLASYFIALGEVVGQGVYFWEVVNYEHFASLKAFKDMVLARNYGAGEVRPEGISLALSNGDIVVVQPGTDYPIRKVTSGGRDVPLNRFWYDSTFPTANPLMEVFEVDSRFNFTGVRYAENPVSGVIHVWNPFVQKFLVIDSSDFKNPKRSESSSPIVTARQDLVDEITPSVGYWGSWYGPKYCPANQYAVSYRMRVEPNQGSDDDTSLNSVQLECRPVDGSSSTWISSHDGYWGAWTSAASCSNANPRALTNFLSGAQLRVETPRGSGDDTAANDATFACSAGGTVNPGGGRSFGSWSSMARCGYGSVVCGISSRVEGPTDDDTALNGMRLMCCKPPAACSSPINEGWTQDLGSSASAWTPAFGDPVVDVSNRRLRISRDDIVDLKTPISGGYVFSYDVTLSGGTVFTPYVWTDGVLLPSIRRSGNDMQFGGQRYGVLWSDVEPAGFAGQRAVGVLSGRVTTYVKAQAKQMAMVVSAGGNVYRSGWVSLTWPETNVAQFRFVGQNTSEVYSGNDDYVYVGPLSGCSGYTDANIDALYAR